MVLLDGASELDAVSLVIAETGEEIKSWTEYSYTQRFDSPLDNWSFTMSGDGVLDLLDKLTPGIKVQLKVNNLVQCTGYIEKVKAKEDRGGGFSLGVMGSTILFPAVKGCIDPKFKFAEGMTLETVVLEVLFDFGITQLEGSSELNLSAMTGAKFKPKPKPKKGKKKEATPCKDISPHDGEGAYAYLDRLLKRNGLFLWARADGSGVVVDKPDFETLSPHRLLHLKSSFQSNVQSGDLELNYGEQPSILAFKAKNTGGKDGNIVYRSIKVNELTGYDLEGAIVPSALAILNDPIWRSAKVIPPNRSLFEFRQIFGRDLIARPFFKVDSESKGQDQLESCVKREMAKLQHQALTLSYEVEGHTQSGIPYAVNTLIACEDDAFGISAPLWVSERRFSKSRGAGTKTQLNLILPYSMDI